MIMNELDEIIKNPNVTNGDLIDCFEKIKERGDVAMIKFDGERLSNNYTALITFPSGKHDLIRSDSNTFKNAMLNVLREYVKIQ